MTDQEIREAAQAIAESIVESAHNSGPCPIVWITGNNYMPPLRSFAEAEAVWQDDADGQDFAELVDQVESRLTDANVLLDCPEYDNALYAVDTARFEHVESDGDNLADEWRPVG